MDKAENEFEEAAIEAYNESLLSIQNFNTKLNFYRLNLELYNFKFFSPIFSLIHKSLQFKRENAPGESQGGFSYSSNSLTNAIFLDYFPGLRTQAKRIFFTGIEYSKIF